MLNEYLSSETMYTIDQFTINEIGIPSPVLMERAAYSVFLEMKEQLTKEDVILLVAGSGNNGGDAVALARMLYLADYQVQLYVTNRENYSEGMASQMKIAQNIELPITFEFEKELFEKASYIVDGVFGIGISREIEGEFKTIIEGINQQEKSTIIALDIPSGLSAKTGQPFETVVKADVTYTFGFLKNGMDTFLGENICGNIIICDLGYPETILKKHGIISA